MSVFQPLVIQRSDPRKIQVDWADGHHTSYSSAELRRLCPCAHCVSETTGQRILDPASVPDYLTHLDVRMVGNYAIAIRFSDGHETGIYPFRMLREADPAV